MSGSGSDSSGWSYETFMTWKIENLKEYLRKRGLKLVGTKAELAARCFCAYEQSVPVVPTEQQKYISQADLYKRLLKAEGNVNRPKSK